MTGLRTLRKTPIGSSDEPAPLPAGRWAIDTDRSTVAFRIRHLTVATVHGAFERFEGWLETDASGVVAAGGTVESTSVSAGDDRRDTALREPGFLDAANYPVIALTTTDVEEHEGQVTIVADLTMKGNTRPIRLTGSVDLIEGGSESLSRARITAAGTISRSEFGVTGGGVLESHGAVVSDTVKVDIDVSFVLQPEDER